ncbi:MAG: DUF561 domain-containing protein, partial [Flavisolibacter sp.]|nr:DUF561 domain-containing protein [Flavisolibacter sp.]
MHPIHKNSGVCIWAKRSKYSGSSCSFSAAQALFSSNNFSYECVDIAADADLVRLAKGLTGLPVCVSAVEPDKFVSATQAGADLIEIGNFDSFYAQGRRFEAEEVLALTQETRSLLPNITLSVTVPHILTLDRQVQLAEDLVKAGADIIQTEGVTSSTPRSAGTFGLIEKAAPTLAAAYEISRAVPVPVLCASGLSNVTVPMAIAAGAAG